MTAVSVVTETKGRGGKSRPVEVMCAVARRIALLAALLCGSPLAGAGSVELSPVTAADGQFAQTTMAGETVWQNTGTSSYLYFKRPASFAFTQGQTLYVRVTYFDDQGGGKLNMQYDGRAGNYTAPSIHIRTSRVATGRFVDGYFEMADVFFGGRQNSGADFRVICGAPGGVNLSVRRVTLSDAPFADPDFHLAVSRAWQTRYTGPARDDVDPTTLKGKVMTGYQGWFRTPNDLYDNGWTHWVSGNTMTADHFTVDMWPDLTQYDPASLAPAGSVMTASGAPAYLFSSASYTAVQKHFRWMRKHNIDGAWLQRFSPNAGSTPEWVLRNVSQAAAEEGRIWGVEYDVSSLDDATVAAKLQADWEWLTTRFDILNDPRYVHEEGKPVVFIWGLSVPDRGFSTASANAVVDYFKAQGVHVLGGIPNTWSSLSSAWQTHIAKYDGVLVWMNKNTSDAAFFSNRGQDFYPHIWPGFSWAHLKQLPASSSFTNRDGGQYYWDKGREWINTGGTDRLFIGMFDEYDESTAIMPMTDDPPPPWTDYGRFLNNQGNPSDWWMMLTDELKRMMWGQRANTGTLPTVASLGNRSNIGAEASVDLGATDETSLLTRVQTSDGNTIVETVGGRECRGNLDPATDRYLYFKVDDSLAWQMTDGDVTVEVEYFDSNTSTVLGLHYDGTGGAFTVHPQPITTTGSNTWRTVRFEIADAYFGNRQNGGADFRLSTGGRKLKVNRVWVRLPEPRTHPFTWTNAAPGPTMNWSQNANWLGGIVAQPDPTSTVRIFTGQTLAGGTVSISNNVSGQVFNRIELGGQASSVTDTTVTVSGNSLSLDGIAPTIALDATKSAFDLIYNMAVPLSLPGPTQVGGDGDATFRLSGAISGSGSLVKTGSCAVVLSAANTYTGATTINAGSLEVRGSIATSSSVMNHATLLFNSGSAQTYANIIGGSGTLIKQGNGKLILTGANSYSGNTTVSAGMLSIGQANISNNSSTVTIATAAKLDLAFTGTDTVARLVIGATAQPDGVYGKVGSASPVIGISQITGNGTLTVISSPPPASYVAWASTNAPATAGDPNADEDQDAVANAIEFVLGGTSRSRDLSKLPTISISETSILFTFKRDQASINASTALTILAGITLLSWPDSYVVGADTAGSSAGVVVIKNDPAGFDTVTLSLPRSTNATKFLRLQVTVTP